MQGCELVISKEVKAIAEGCRRLNFLRAANCKKIDDVGMVKIEENCPDMEELDLEDCKAVIDVGIMAIADRCTNLKNLKINRCKKVQMVRSVSLFLGEHDVLGDTIMLGIIGNIKELVLLNFFMCNGLSYVAITTTANF